MPETPVPSPFSRLYPILDASLETEETIAGAVAALARAGCRLVQLRAKELTTKSFYRWARIARRVSRDAGIRLVINDRVDVALLVGADGVHLGQEDLSPAAARELLGPGALIGLSTHTLDESRAARFAPVDYVAVGPVFETSTKKSGRRALGVEGVRGARSVVGKPLVAIGGITLDRGRALLDAGADAVAVISALKARREGESLESLAREWLSRLEAE